MRDGKFSKKIGFSKKGASKNFKTGVTELRRLSCCMCLQQNNGSLVCFLDVGEAYACSKASKNDTMICFSFIAK